MALSIGISAVLSSTVADPVFDACVRDASRVPPDERAAIMCVLSQENARFRALLEQPSRGQLPPPPPPPLESDERLGLGAAVGAIVLATTLGLAAGFGIGVLSR